METKTPFQELVDTVYGVTSAIRSGFSANVTMEPYGSGFTVSPVQQQRTSLIPWLIAGGCGLALLLVLITGD